MEYYHLNVTITFIISISVLAPLNFFDGMDRVAMYVFSFCVVFLSLNYLDWVYLDYKDGDEFSTVDLTCLRYPLFHFKTATIMQLVIMVLRPLEIPDAEVPLPYALNFYLVWVLLNHLDHDRTNAIWQESATPGSGLQPRRGWPY